MHAWKKAPAPVTRWKFKYIYRKDPMAMMRVTACWSGMPTRELRRKLAIPPFQGVWVARHGSGG